MSFIRARSTFRPALALALALAVVPSAVAAAKPHEERLVVRGDAKVVDGPCDAGGCRLELTEGRFRGAPIGPGAYAGSIKLRLAEFFPNGEGGSCAPLKSRLVLGAGTPNRLILGVTGDSCQDGGGPLDSASFTGLSRFTVKRGTGKYAGTTGSGLAKFAEDAANNHRMTLIGRLAR